MVVDRINDQSFLSNVTETGELILNALTQAHHNQHKDHGVITAVRGLGLLLGLQVKPGYVSQIVDRARERGVIVLTAAGDTVRLAPPLILTKEQAQEVADVLVGIVVELENENQN